MRALFAAAAALLILAGSVLTYAGQDVRINLKQLVQNQIAQIKARGEKQEVSAVKGEAPAPVENKLSQESSANASVGGNRPLNVKAEEKKPLKSEERIYPKSVTSKADDGLFLKIFILVDLSLLAALFVYWRRRKLKIGMAEKAKFKKNISKLRSEGRFHRRTKGEPVDLRKRLQNDPVLDVQDEALLRSHARKLSVPQGELLLASRIRSLEKAIE